MPRPGARVDLTGLGATPVATTAIVRHGSRRRLLVVVLAVLAVLGGFWAAGYLDRLVSRSYPVVDPFALIIEKPAGQPLSTLGYVPDPDMQLALIERVRQSGGTPALTLATGDLVSSWSTEVTALIDAVQPLDSWRIVITDNSAEVTGQTGDPALRDRINAQLAAMPGALSGTASIIHVVPELPAATLDSLIAGLADCGPLTLSNRPATGAYPDGAEIALSGTVAGDGTLAAVESAMRAAAGTRPLDLGGVSVLNPALCLIENFLPRAPTSDIRIDFGNGGADGVSPNANGDFVVGDNPVIDVILPAEMTDGTLSVSIIDVSGDVFHLLPNLTRPQADIAALREGQTGPVQIRVAYDVATAMAEGRIGFQVDDTALGKSKVVVMRSTGPLFDTIRPTSESASGYAEALRDGQSISDARILSLDSRILTTALP